MGGTSDFAEFFFIFHWLILLGESGVASYFNVFWERKCIEFHFEFNFSNPEKCYKA